MIGEVNCLKERGKKVQHERQKGVKEIISNSGTVNDPPKREKTKGGMKKKRYMGGGELQIPEMMMLDGGGVTNMSGDPGIEGEKGGGEKARSNTQQ